MLYSSFVGLKEESATCMPLAAPYTLQRFGLRVRLARGLYEIRWWTDETIPHAELKFHHTSDGLEFLKRHSAPDPDVMVALRRMVAELEPFGVCPSDDASVLQATAAHLASRRLRVVRQEFVYSAFVASLAGDSPERETVLPAPREPSRPPTRVD